MQRYEQLLRPGMARAMTPDKTQCWPYPIPMTIASLTQRHAAARRTSGAPSTGHPAKFHRTCTRRRDILFFYNFFVPRQADVRLDFDSAFGRTELEKKVAPLT
jgi:hypothetical protein